MRYIYLTTIFSVVFAFEKDITFTVQAGMTDCFYQKAQPNELIDIEYQVHLIISETKLQYEKEYIFSQFFAFKCFKFQFMNLVETF